MPDSPSIDGPSEPQPHPEAAAARVSSVNEDQLPSTPAATREINGHPGEPPLPDGWPRLHTDPPIATTPMSIFREPEPPKGRPPPTALQTLSFLPVCLADFVGDLVFLAACSKYQCAYNDEDHFTYDAEKIQPVRVCASCLRCSAGRVVANEECWMSDVRRRCYLTDAKNPIFLSVVGEIQNQLLRS
uniref:Uncharacterized protein n=1 Tax=Mycena chlorophos TaxID=658473 RepID=A0ABQ0LSW7_MYCCL|nr:predicted protein [Mycena chlorophos]